MASEASKADEALHEKIHPDESQSSIPEAQHVLEDGHPLGLPVINS